MARSRLLKSAAAGLALLVITAVAATVSAQAGLPNPYREEANWAKLPAGAKPSLIMRAPRCPMMPGWSR